ncbi:MAG: 4-alpha-glucanotransferase, partial [Ewingella sp.]|nr:4-alpha-glucanotransferase [Ewingella sp.]
MEGKQLEHAAQQAGIVDSFINMQDEVQSVSDETKQALLSAMGRAEPDLGSASPLPAVLVFHEHQPVELAPQYSSDLHWQLTLENGDVSSGEHVAKQPLRLPNNLPTGYHQLTLSHGKKQWGCRIIIAPRRCYEPQAVLNGEKLWGATVQLYTLRSEKNWGVGDFGDLKQMLEQVAQRGGAFIGLNPIHALYPANPLSASPYSPSSRRWLNVTYIDVSQVPEFIESEEAQSWWREPETRDALHQARSREYVDYAQVMKLKFDGLKLAWKTFVDTPEASQRKRDFRSFVHLGGESLYQLAVFDALHIHLRDLDLGLWGWPVWPE